MSITRYCLMVVVDSKRGFTIGITKKKGPAFLLNRITFPGGHVEEGETSIQAATRELKEETDVFVDESAWRLLYTLGGDDWTMDVLCAESDRVLHARQMEHEPVWHLACTRHLVYADQQPGQYAPDFKKHLQAALARLAAQEPVAA